MNVVSAVRACHAARGGLRTGALRRRIERVRLDRVVSSVR